MKDLSLQMYLNGNCTVEIHPSGTKRRYVREGEKPAPDFPESMDVKITNWCDAGCDYCHEASTPKGSHADLLPTLDLLSTLPGGVEVAIGGGHPLAHPGFDDFVQELTKQGLICNVTVNEHHFLKEEARLTKLIADGLVKGVGYSYREKPCEFKYEHLVSHVIAGTVHQSELRKIIQVNPKILLLGYKIFGKGNPFFHERNTEIADNLRSWKDRLFETVEIAHTSFDNLAIEQLDPIRVFKDKEDFAKFYMGEEGTFSMYIDAVRQKVAQNSYDTARHSYLKDICETFKKVSHAT